MKAYLFLNVLGNIHPGKPWAFDTVIISKNYSTGSKNKLTTEFTGVKKKINIDEKCSMLKGTRE